MIFGSIRSGSTWLAEIVSSIDGYLQIFEPLHPAYVKEMSGQNLEKNRYVPVDKEWPFGNDIFNRIISGKLVNAWILSQVTVRDIIRGRRLVVKVVRGNLLLEWYARNVAVLQPALVIRHPCAVIASHLNKKWQPDKRALLGNPYFDQYPEIRERCMALSEPEEVAALAWCTRYHAPLMSSKPYPFILVCYESLVRNGEREVTRLADAWDIPDKDKLLARLSVPSDTSTSSSQVVKGKDPLAGWCNRLNDDQVNNILSVLEIFGMDFYSAELEPDYDRLAAFGKPHDD
jgi:hypothetical protein